MDKKGGTNTTHSNSVKKITELSANLDLIDIWRVAHPDQLRYTWRQRNPEIHCRLDYFLVSQGLSISIKEADIFPGFRTDHSMITISLLLNTNPKGPSYWKLNSSFLTEQDHMNEIQTVISKL